MQLCAHLGASGRYMEKKEGAAKGENLLAIFRAKVCQKKRNKG
jgi:hypothetical protein